MKAKRREGVGGKTESEIEPGGRVIEREGNGVCSEGSTSGESDN